MKNKNDDNNNTTWQVKEMNEMMLMNAVDKRRRIRERVFECVGVFTLCCVVLSCLVELKVASEFTTFAFAKPFAP